ncbi:DNA-formamidopyrimidine glycosylase family protein [Chitinophagaceae bacterium MMS25-I14]
MPEGPSIVILKELVQPFCGKKIIEAGGNAKIDMGRLKGRVIRDFKSWGKQFLIVFDDFMVRIHLLMFGSYRINEEKEGQVPRLSLHFAKGQMFNVYTCSVKILEGKPDDYYDWSEDIMSDEWNPAKAKKSLKTQPGMLACDALLDQHIFSGSGNIIKNEVLFLCRIHPESKIGDLPAKKLSELIKQTHDYAFDFLKWKKQNELKKHWLAHTKKICPRCDIPFHKEHLGKTNRRSFFCTNCQLLYTH